MWKRNTRPSLMSSGISHNQQASGSLSSSRGFFSEHCVKSSAKPRSGMQLTVHVLSIIRGRRMLQLNYTNTTRLFPQKFIIGALLNIVTIYVNLICSLYRKEISSTGYLVVFWWERLMSSVGPMPVHLRKKKNSYVWNICCGNVIDFCTWLYLCLSVDADQQWWLSMTSYFRSQ